MNTEQHIYYSSNGKHRDIRSLSDTNKTIDLACETKQLLQAAEILQPYAKVIVATAIKNQSYP
jgi:hypothetical protein